MYNFKGGISGGTLASAISSIEDAPVLTHGAMNDFSYRERERVPPIIRSRDPCTNSAKAKGLPSKRTKLICSVPIDGKTWYGGAFPMCRINRLVVHHTWSLFKRSQDRYPEKVYGDNFTYGEIVAKQSFHQAALYILGLSVFIAGLLFPPVRLPRLLELVSPS